MTKDPALIILSNSKFVCDSLHLADLLWGGRHDNALRDLSKMVLTAKSEGNLLKCEEISFTDENGRTYQKMDFTRKDLSILCAYSEKLRPYFLKYIDQVDSRIAEEIAQLKAEAAQLKAEAALLKTANVKLLEAATIEKVETDFGRKYVKNIPDDKKMVLQRDEETGERFRVPASSLSYDELLDYLIGMAAPKAQGILEAADRLRNWRIGVITAQLARRTIPTLKEYGAGASYAGVIMQALEKKVLPKY